MNVKKRVIIKLGGWTIDSLALSASRDDDEQHLPAKVMAVLVYLAENHGRLVTRQELIDSIWEGNAYVGEKTLTNAVWRIRQILDSDSGETESIKTTPKIGYQLLLEPDFSNDELDGRTPEAWRRRSSTLILAAVGLLIAVTVIVVSVLRQQGRPVENSLALVTQLPGRELYARPAPDGSKFAFMHVSQAGSQDLYVQSLEDTAGDALKFTAENTSNFSPTWAPDSRHLAYIRIDDQSDVCDVVVRDMDLGTEVVIGQCLDRHENTLSWSPDGRLLVYRKDDPTQGQGLYVKVMSSNFRPTEELVDRRLSCVDCSFTDQEVSWSPDSKRLAVTRTRNSMSEDVHLFDLEAWEFQRLTFDEPSIEGHTWDKAGENILYVSDKHSLNRRIWVVNIESRRKRELGIEGAGHPSYLPDYESIIFYRRRAQSYIAGIVIGDADSASSIPAPIVQTSGTERNPAYSSVNNRLAFYSNRSGFNEIWVADPDGSNSVQLTHLNSSAKDPSWSPAGDKIAFVVYDNDIESAQVRILDLASGATKTVAKGFHDIGAPTWASDGESLIVPIWRTKRDLDLWRVNVDGNQLVRLTHNGAEFGRESPSGDQLYFSKSGSRGLFRLDFSDGTETRVINDMVSTGYGNWTWAEDGQILYSRRKGGHSEIVKFDIESQRKEVVLKHPGRVVHRFGMLSYSPRERMLYFTHREPQQIDILTTADPLSD